MATINGTSGNDSLTGTGANDTLNGLGGNDTLVGSGGTDFYDGGSGSDTLDFRVAAAGVSVNFSDGTVSGGFSGTFANIERVLGGNGADILIGAAGGQNLSGRTGSDWLAGGVGVDTLWGGAGGDSFVFRETGTANADRVSDFASGSDAIVLDASVMNALGAEGHFAAGDARFKANSTGTATDSSDRVIYETDTRQIWYDADGNGAGARQLIATLQSGATLVATDIRVLGSSEGGQTINGTSGDDSLVGGNGPDTIDGLGGNDTLIGNPGADLLRGDNGNDRLVATDGVDADGSVDTLDGGFGDDVYEVNDGDGDVILDDPGGIDTVIAWHSDWTLGPGLDNLELADMFGVGSNGTGNELDNRIVSATEGGTILGLGGNDTLDVRPHSENTVVARGGDGDDTLLGSGGERDQLFGDAGNDLLAGGGRASTMTGGAGADVFYFDTSPDPFASPDPALRDESELITDFASATDTIRLDATVMPALGASGRFSGADARFAANSTGTAQDSSDRVIYNTSNGDLWYDADGSGTGVAALIGTLQGAPKLNVTDIEVVNGTAPSGQVINGTSGNDTLSGTSGNDTINGLGGNDLFLAGASGGADVIDGGAGYDSIEFKDRATSAVMVDYGAGTISGGPGSISFTNIERVVAGNFNDSLTGSAAAQNLTGQVGSDTLWGAGGADTLWGGSGTDTFIFREMGTANADRIGDWVSGSDKLHLDDAAFMAIGATGNFASGDGRFWSSSTGTAHDANDRVIYNTSTGSLYYDADGSGTGAAQLIATFTGNPAVAATDIVVI